jgi:hypothetical protein
MNFMFTAMRNSDLTNKMKMSLKINKFYSFGVLSGSMIHIHFGTVSNNDVRPITKAYYDTGHCLWQQQKVGTDSQQVHKQYKFDTERDSSTN